MQRRPWWSHMLVVIPQPGVHICIDLHLHAKKGHREAVKSGVARQRIRGLAAHPKLRRTVCGTTLVDS